jgi:hypothetical protein
LPTLLPVLLQESFDFLCFASVKVCHGKNGWLIQLAKHMKGK